MKYTSLATLLIVSLTACEPLTWRTVNMEEKTTHAYKNEIDTLREKHENLVILFYRPRCPYCVYIMPIFDQLKKEANAAIHFAAIDITRHNEYKKQYGFSTVPTVVYFKNGKAEANHGSNNRGITTDDMKKYLEKVYGE